VRIKDELPFPLGLLFGLLREKKEGHAITLQPGDSWWSDLLRRYAGSPPPDVKVGPEDLAALFFSGGTTGIPKAAAGTHRALLATGMQLHAWFTGLLADWDDVIMLTMPLFHVYGNVGVMCTGLVGLNRLALIPNPRDLTDLLETIREVKPAFLPGVPTLFSALLNHPDVQAGTYNFRSIKLCISGAAPLMEETKRRFEAITGGKMIEAYAMTETMCSAVCIPPLGTYKPGSTGIPTPDMVVRIGDPETGEGWLAPGEVGEICIQTPALMHGYWGNPVETANMIRDGWLYSGDLGYLDEDGYLFIVDRKKDLIKPSGFQVWPREVEEVLAAHPAVAEVCVGGIPDAHSGEAVKAWIVQREGMRVSEDELRTWCREKLAAYKLPKYIEFRSSLPKSTVGKILRRELVSGM
jgi:long-chain acyl-CoA synthetase